MALMVRALVLAMIFLVARGVPGQPTRVLHIRVFLVNAEGKASPVPGHALLVSDNPTSALPRRVVTRADGTAYVTTVRPLSLACAPSASPALANGQEIFALGAPLRQPKGIASGTVSRVDMRAVVSDLVLATGSAGGPVFTPVKHFKSDFLRLRAFCGEAEVTPVHPFKLEQRVSDTDAIYEGLYVFDPGALGPGCGTVKPVLYSEKEPEKADTRVVDPKILQQISQDFEP